MNFMALTDAIKIKKWKKAIDWHGPLPNHIAIMMDGNGRWATRRGLPRSAGHYAGMNAMKEIIRICNDIELGMLTLYAFSTENWKRPTEEVQYIISLVGAFMTESNLKQFNDNGIQIRFIGDISAFPDETQAMMQDAVRRTSGNDGMIVNFAMNYGGRAEIVHAVKRFAAENGKEELDPDMFENYLYTSGCPSPELIIRTSGEKRLSGFLLWQSAQAELWFTDEMWPSFTEPLLYQALYDYQQRKRRQ